MTLLVTRRSQIPGSRFNPSEQELIHILDRKNRGKNRSFITEMDVYEKEPWLLQHVRHFRSVKNEWFYFATMKKAPGIKKENSKRTSRTVAPGLTWKGNTKTTPITDKNGVTIGYDKTLTFLAKDKAKFLAKATGWVMHEFTLSNAEFQEMVLCRIRFNPDKDNAQYAPSLEPIVIGQPKPPRDEETREDCLTLLSNQIHLNYVPADDAPIETHRQGVEPQQQQHQLWNGSRPNEAVSYLTGQPQHLMNGGMAQYQDFGSFGQFVGDQPYYQNMLQGMPENKDFGSYDQYWGGDLTQNHLPSVPIETHQGVEQQQKLWTGSCPSHEAFFYSTGQHQQLMNGGIEEYQNFGSFGQFVGAQSYYQNMLQGMPENQDFGSCAQYCGGDLTQTHHSVISMDTQKGIEPQQHDNSCFVDNVVENHTTEQQHSNLSVTHQNMMEEQQEFVSSTKFSGGDLTQNHLSMVTMASQKDIEPQQKDNSCFGHNVVVNETTETPNLTQEQNQPLGELDETDDFMNMELPLELEDMTNFGNEDWRKQLGELDDETDDFMNMELPLELEDMANFGNEDWRKQLGELDDETDDFMNMEFPLELEDMANFGNEDWRKQLGENTPEEEAELKAEIEKCKTLASLVDYVCPSH